MPDDRISARAAAAVSAAAAPNAAAVAAKAQTVSNVKRYEEVYVECLTAARRIAEARGWGEADDERVLDLTTTLFNRFLDDQLAAQKDRAMKQYAGNLMDMLEPLLNRGRLM